jgi:hypothetical protein
LEKTAKALEGIKAPKFTGNLFEELKRLDIGEKNLQKVRKEMAALDAQMKSGPVRAKRRPQLDDEGEDDDCAPGPFEVIVHRWSREPWPSKLQKILEGLEITALDEGSRLYLQRQLHISDMFGKDAQGHVVMTLRCITESEGNENALSEMMVRAVSNAIGPYKDRGIDLIEAFDQIPLNGIFEQMRDLEYFYQSEAPSALERILKHKLRRILTPPQPELPSKEELRAARKRAKEEARQATEAAIGRSIRNRIELGIQLAELRDATPNNKRFGNIVRKQFDIHDSLFVGELQRVVRRYGDRQDVTGKVRNWHVLVALSSPYLPEPARREFEAKILAGEKVLAKTVAASRVAKRRGGRPSKAAITQEAGHHAG